MNAKFYQTNNELSNRTDTKKLNVMQLKNFQIDYVKLSKIIDSREEINWNNLIPHPNLKKHYTLKPELSENAKNFSLYMQGEYYVTIRFSVPYFLKGHNYTSIAKQELLEVERRFKKWLNIDIKFAHIKEFEFGAFEKIDMDSKKYIANIKGIGSYNLEKATPNFKMYGDPKRKFHYKIYDAVANAKSKKTYTKGNYPKGNLIKHELKFEDASKFFNYGFFFIDFYDDSPSLEYFKKLLLDNWGSLIFKTEHYFSPAKGDLANILYTALKNLESESEDTNVVELLNETIDETDLSASQKSKRRKAIQHLDRNYNYLDF